MIATWQTETVEQIQREKIPMSIAAITATSVSGMQAQSKRLVGTAGNIANITTPGYSRVTTQLTPEQTGGVSATLTRDLATETGKAVDPAQEMLDLIGAKLAFEANASVFETGADMWQMIATINKD